MKRTSLRVARRGQAPMQQDKSAHRLFCWQLEAAGYRDFKTEHRFASCIGRNWAFDIAFPERLLAIEIDGGIWVAGAHGHPITIVRNMEKRNWAARLGWRVLAFSTDQAKNGEAIAFTEAVLMKIIGLTPREELYAGQQPVAAGVARRRNARALHRARAKNAV